MTGLLAILAGVSCTVPWRDNVFAKRHIAIHRGRFVQSNAFLLAVNDSKYIRASRVPVSQID